MTSIMNNLTSDERPGKPDIMETDVELGPVPAWSFSTLKNFSECKYRIYLNKVKKLQEPSGEAAERGTRIHNEAEDFVKGKLDVMPKDLQAYEEVFGDFKALKQSFNDGKVSLEGEWAFTIEWKKTGWVMGDTWARIKLDAFEHYDETSGKVIDYKTGKKMGNEISHGEQGMLYAIAAFFFHPELEFVDVEFWYTDQKEKTKKSYTREQAMKFWPGWHKRGVAMTTETEFDPTPSTYACRWCHFKKGTHPECRYGI